MNTNPDSAIADGFDIDVQKLMENDFNNLNDSTSSSEPIIPQATPPSMPVMNLDSIISSIAPPMPPPIPQQVAMREPISQINPQQLINQQQVNRIPPQNQQLYPLQHIRPQNQTAPKVNTVKFNNSVEINEIVEKPELKIDLKDFVSIKGFQISKTTIYIAIAFVVIVAVYIYWSFKQPSKEELDKKRVPRKPVVNYSHNLQNQKN